MNSQLALIGAPTSAGAYAPGQEKAPAVFRAHGIVQAIRRAGWEVRDAGDVAGFRWQPDPLRPKAMNLEAVVGVAQRVADRVADALHAGEMALVLGGDCTIELGSLAGALRESRSVGLIYIDLDTDLNLATLTIAEVNPDHAPDQAETFAALISTLANAMARHGQL